MLLMMTTTTATAMTIMMMADEDTEDAVHERERGEERGERSLCK